MRSSLIALAAALAVSLLLPRTASARPSAREKGSVGVDMVFVLPVGELADADTGPLVGPILRLGYLVSPRIEINGRVGYLFGLEDRDRFSLSDLPVWLGARAFFLDAPAGPYAGAEFGLNVLLPRKGSSSDNLPRLGFNLQAGYVISKNIPIDLRLQFHYLNLAGKDEKREPALLGVGLSAGYTAFF